MGFGFGMFNVFDTLFPIMFILVFCLIIGMFVYTIATQIKTNHKNNQSPVLTVNAKIVAKRNQVNRHHNSINDNMTSSHPTTQYFVTFEVESGDRMEFNVPNNEFGYMVENDFGKLTFQGTRFIEFNRETSFINK